MSEIRPENDVNKMTIPQVILLTLLTTTVASVATAIVTVQLMSGVPGETVFQTIERVTETVVQRPVETGNTTVIVKEGDLVAKAVSENSNSAYALYFGDETVEVSVLGYGFRVGDNTLVSRPYANPDRLVTAGLRAVSTHGSDALMLWRIIDEEERFTGKQTVNFVEGNPQVGQTLVYLSGDGAIVRGSITGVSTTGLEFSENLSNRDAGLLLDVGGDVLGMWTGYEALRSVSIITQIDQLATNPLHEIPIGGEFSSTTPIETNPDDVTQEEKQEGCELLGGVFNEYDECGGIDQSACSVLGGTWNECGSACRHDADAQVCTQQCVQYCQL